jgi:hypothetical protein
VPFVSNPGDPTPPQPAGGSNQTAPAQSALGSYQEVLGALLSGTNLNATLKPVPAAVSEIQARDPAFDETSFLARAEYAYHLVEQAISQQKPEVSRQVMADALWLQHRDALLAAQRGAPAVPAPPPATARVTAAHTDASYDTIVVRFTPTAGGQAQDWSFQRSSGAVTKPGAPAVHDKCPNCGAPLQLDDAGVCSYCHAVVSSGAYDWVLARTEPVANPYGAWTTLYSGGREVDIAAVIGAAEGARRVGRASRMIIQLILFAFVLGPVAIAVVNVVPLLLRPAAAPQGGSGTRYVGNLALTSGVTLGPLNLSGTSNSHPSCRSLAADDAGATYTFTSSSGVQPSRIELDIAHPTGVGSWDASRTDVTVLQTLLTGNGGTQTWKKGSGSSISLALDADDKHTLSFSNLQPQAAGGPNPVPLSGTYSETCTNR